MQLKEQRKTKRRHLIYYLSAVDAGSGETLGYVYDITTKGLMLLCSEPVTVGSTFRLRIEIPANLSLSDSFEVEAECRWCREDVNPDNHICGFFFTQIDRASAVMINTLVARFGFTD